MPLRKLACRIARRLLLGRKKGVRVPVRRPVLAMLALLGLGGVTSAAVAAPTVSRLTPPSNAPGLPIVARFLPGQRFDLQATVQPNANTTITSVQFLVDGVVVPGSVNAANTVGPANPGLVANLAANTVIATQRAVAFSAPGVHTLTVNVVQSDGTSATRQGVFEIVGITQVGRRAKNVIVLIGDGMGIAHRTAARQVLTGVYGGKARAPLAMDTFPVTGMVMTSSLNSIVTDSAPGASCYSTGNKNNNNQEGVFPDDTTANFDNPRTEYMAEYLHRTLGKTLGIVTTADVFDATPAAFAVHTQARSAGTGICDQYLDEAVTKRGLRVLLGGGRKWFLPATTPGSSRNAANDYVLPGELAAAYAVPAGQLDANRNLLGDFQTAGGFTYAATRAQMAAVPATADRLLGLFQLGNMNVALDKIGQQRGTGTVPADYGFPDQPMLDEMTNKALAVLNKNPNGFTLMIEGAHIDKQAHAMDTERWLLDTIEFDRAVAACRRFAEQNPDTLVIVTADHECAGVNIIGSSLLTNAELTARSTAGGGVSQLRDGVVGLYEAAGFPRYTIAPDGYPVSTDPDRKILIGYAANSDRYEDWLTNVKPLSGSTDRDPAAPPLVGYVANPIQRDTAGQFFLQGHVPGNSAAHTASDIPVSAFGRGASLFTGVMDNTDVFFKAMQVVLGGAR